MKKNRYYPTKSGRASVPNNNKRGCLCRNGTYSRECCGNDYYNQGIGNVTGDGT